ncbi:MAG: DUF2161 family putative PD-(D/E)XK-type phosphodiesterase [Pseudomonadota bacterium]
MTKARSFKKKAAPTGVVSETQLDEPIRDWLASQGFTVRAEVHHCDLAAFRENDLVVVELKRSLGLEVILQAVDRQRICPSVYIAVPGPLERTPPARRRKILHLLRRLELGLAVVDFEASPPETRVILHPEPHQARRNLKRKRILLEEAGRRSGDFNQGGSTGRKLVTVYREKAVFIACCLARFGPLSTAQVRKLGGDAKCQAILYDNHYKWFLRIGRGLYRLSQQGREELESYPQLAAKINEDLKNADLGGDRDPVPGGAPS